MVYSSNEVFKKWCVPSKFYNETVTNHTAVIAKDDRLIKYQTKMIAAARNRGLPVLGICMGSHLLNIIDGGKIDQ